MPMYMFRRQVERWRRRREAAETARAFDELAGSLRADRPSFAFADAVVAAQLRVVDENSAIQLEHIKRDGAQLEATLPCGVWTAARFSDGRSVLLASPSCLPPRGFRLVDWFPAGSAVELRFVRRRTTHVVWADAIR